MIVWPPDAETEELKDVAQEFIWTYQPRNRVPNKLLTGVFWAFVIELGLLGIALVVLRLLGVV